MLWADVERRSSATCKPDRATDDAFMAIYRAFRHPAAGLECLTWRSQSTKEGVASQPVRVCSSGSCRLLVQYVSRRCNDNEERPPPARRSCEVRTTGPRCSGNVRGVAPKCAVIQIAVSIQEGWHRVCFWERRKRRPSGGLSERQSRAAAPSTRRPGRPSAENGGRAARSRGSPARRSGRPPDSGRHARRPSSG